MGVHFTVHEQLEGVYLIGIIYRCIPYSALVRGKVFVALYPGIY